MTAEAQQACRIALVWIKPVINCFETLNPLKFGNCLINPFKRNFFIIWKSFAWGI